MKTNTDWRAWLQRLPILVTFVLVIILAQTMASMTWRLVPQPVQAQAPVSSTDLTVTNVSVARTDSVNLRDLTSWDLFGRFVKEAPKPVVVAEPEPEIAPDTQLRLTLKGVFASRDPDDAWAIVSDHLNNEDTYGIEDEMPGGAILKEVFSDRIILLHNRRRETLRLPQDELDGNSRQNVASNRSRRNSSRPRVSANNSPVQRLTGEAVQVIREYREKLLTDPQSVMNAVRAEPYRKGGRLMGYRVFPGADRQLMSKVGLQPGDVVTSVNGIELDSPLKGLEIMQNISGATEVSVNVLRNGVTQTFQVPVN